MRRGRGCLGEECSLVVAAQGETRPMQRHGCEDRIAAGQQLGAGARQPAAERRRAVQAVGVLEREDKAAAGIVVAERGAGAIKARRLRQACTTEDWLATRSGVELERRAATIAMRRPEPHDAGPA